MHRGTGPRATVRKLIFLAKRFLILDILEILLILIQTIKTARASPAPKE